MKVYVMLPLTDVVYLDDQSGDTSARLTRDYAINFKTCGRYKFQRIDITDFKVPSFKNPECYRWVYTIIKPKTLSLHR